MNPLRHLAKLTWSPKGFIYFAQDPMGSWFHEPTKNWIYFLNNYNCHNIYRCPLIWLVKNGHIVLTCISFFNELLFIFMRGGDIHAELLFWYCAMLLWIEMDSRQLLTLYFTLTQIFSGEKIKKNLHTTLKLTLFMLISRLMRSRRHLEIWNLRVVKVRHHSLMRETLLTRK